MSDIHNGIFILRVRAEMMLHNFSAASILSGTIFPMWPVLWQHVYFCTVQVKDAILDYKVGAELQKLIKCIVSSDGN